MASQHTPPNTCDKSVLTPLNGSFGTPVNGDGALPKTPIVNRVLESLRSSQSQGSPMLKIPASPVMQRLGYGTGVGVYLLERSPMKCGQICSPWAIKKTNQVMDSSMDETNEIFASRIEYEAEILKKLSHPNIIGYRASGQASVGTAFLAMEKASQSLAGLFLAMEKASQSLADLIEDRVEEVMIIDTFDGAPPFPADKIEKVALDVAKALKYLHEEIRMVHGDIKSANVLVFGDFDTIKLCDFGVARYLEKDGTVDGAYVGTEIWCPMEVIKAKRGQEHVPITHKADIFPFGLTIHEMITLKPPHLSSAEDECCGSEVSANTTTSETLSDDDDNLPNESFDEFAYEEALARFVGTRPPLPDINFDSSYSTILGIFYCCTEEDPLKRPDAKDIITALTESGKEN